MLGSNKITEVSPEVLTGLNNLKELQLFRNKISALPPEIGLLQGINSVLLNGFCVYSNYYLVS